MGPLPCGRGSESERPGEVRDGRRWGTAAVRTRGRGIAGCYFLAGVAVELFAFFFAR